MPKSKVLLYGKKVSREDLTDEVLALINGTSIRRPYPIPVKDVAKILGCSRTTVYQYLKRGKEQPRFKSNGRLELPKSSEYAFTQFNKRHPITSDPLISEWMEALLTRRGGEPIKSWHQRLRAVEAVCNTCKVNPSHLIISTRKTERILRQFAQLAKQGKAWRHPSGREPTKNVKNIVYRRVQGIRDFCGFYGLTWPRNVGGIMSQKIVDHGKYAYLRLTDEELEKADEFIKEQWGLDSDIYRWFWIGIESCARYGALYDMDLDYTKFVNPNTGKITYVFIVFESKTQHVRGGKWHKYITRSNTQKSIDLLKSRGGIRIYESKLSKENFTKLIHSQLSLIYRHIGKSFEYFLKHPTHSLRHVGAHYWLSKKNYNYGLVAEIGGWNTMDELKKSYGQIPPEKILELIET